MQHYTVQDIMALNLCQPTEGRPDDGYPEHRIRDLFGDRQSVTLLDICDDARVPVEDRLWVLHRLLPEPIIHEAACRYAEHALEGAQARGCAPDQRLRAATETRRRWLRGEISDGELNSVEAVAWHAARDAAWVAVIDAARTALAAVDAAAQAERQWQLDMLRAMIEAMEG